MPFVDNFPSIHFTRKLKKGGKVVGHLEVSVHTYLRHPRVPSCSVLKNFTPYYCRRRRDPHKTRVAPSKLYSSAMTIITSSILVALVDSSCHRALSPVEAFSQSSLRRYPSTRARCELGINRNHRCIYLKSSTDDRSTVFTIEGEKQEDGVLQYTNNNDTTDATTMKSIPFNNNTTTSAESAFDNLIPSTIMLSNDNPKFGSMGYVVKRPPTGLSSSVLLPLGENPQQPSGTTFNASSTQQSTGLTSWKDRLIDISNIASFLCVLDCTLLPLVSIALPALSWIAGSLSLGGASTNSVTVALSSMLSFLPALGHGIALYFVIPVGLTTTIVNYFFGHKEIRFSLVALMGVFLIYAANSSSGVGIASVDSLLNTWGILAHSHEGAAHVHDACGAIVGATTSMLSRSEGWAHRTTNTLGCAFLLGSNYASRKFMEENSQGCAANAIAEAFGDGKSDKLAACPSGCGCEQPSFGTKGSSSRTGGEMFFSWNSIDKRSKGGEGKMFSRFRR